MSALCAVVILKPQEFLPYLDGVPVVYLLYGCAVVAIVGDIIWRRVRPALAPQLPFIVAFFGWAILTTILKRPSVVDKEAMGLFIVLGLVAAIAMGFASAKGLRAFAVTFFACAVAVTVVGIVQGTRPFGCMLGAADDWEGKGELSYDGRPCETVLDCRKDAPEPDGNYRCERVGPWSTSSIGGRVRYRGSLADPNELSLMTCAAIPFAFALFEGRRKKRRDRDTPPPSSRARARMPLLVTNDLLDGIVRFARTLPMLAILGAIGVLVVMTQSRTGLIVFLVVVGLYFVRRAGAWGVVVGCFVGPPMLIFGGRSGVEAEQSSNERMDLLREAFELIRQTKGIGIGAGQFADESSIGLTAHNSYVLAAAEAGLVGLVLFGLVVYASMKVPVVIWFGNYDVEERTRRMAAAVAIALSGAAVGIVFLSWAYKDVLYMIFASSAALYAVARAEDPNLRVRISVREVLLVALGMFVLLACFYVGARFEGR